MENNLISLISGGGIAIISGITVQIVNSILNAKREKKKFVFNKLDDIVNSVSNLEQGLQFDMAQVVMTTKPNSENSVNLSFEETKLKCLIDIYHPNISENYSMLQNALNDYYKKKREIIENQRINRKIDSAGIDILGVKFDNCIEEIQKFISALAEYGAQNVK